MISLGLSSLFTTEYHYYSIYLLHPAWWFSQDWAAYSGLTTPLLSHPSTASSLIIPSGLTSSFAPDQTIPLLPNLLSSTASSLMISFWVSCLFASDHYLIYLVLHLAWWLPQDWAAYLRQSIWSCLLRGQPCNDKYVDLARRAAAVSVSIAVSFVWLCHACKGECGCKDIVTSSCSTIAILDT